ncbi:MAG: cob(I)yrinic acid a,c-diamide adenosyltransferase [Bacteroidaceae bacterium]|nr:cob(I)yrinic acid a,c-diamide adenosyltransferase [Bacteroidaceae bacterium]
MSHLYTRTGDTGTTSLVGGQRVPKTHLRLEAYGTVDELNSFIGLLIAEMDASSDASGLERTVDQLTDVQSLLFSIGSILATDTSERDVRPGRYVEEVDVTTLEHAIDAAEEGLPGWRGFILPGGTRAASLAHVCRTVCRRAERAIYRVAEEADVDATLLRYVNRLSDYFFALAKRLNYIAGHEESYWKARS